MSRLPRSIPNDTAASALGLDCPVVGGSSRSEKSFMRNLMNHTEGWGGNWVGRMDVDVDADHRSGGTLAGLRD